MIAKKLLNSWLFFVSGLLILGCASTKVSIQYDKTKDFSSYKTFSLVPPKRASQQPNAVRDPFLKKEILSEIRPVLEKKGYAEAPSENEADFLVVFYTMVQNQRDYVPPVYRVGRWGRTWVARPGQVIRYKEGTLAIDVVDRNKKELIWQGVCKDVLDRNDPSSNLVAAVEKVLEKFPPSK